MSYENIPDPSWQKMFLDLRSENTEVRQEAVEQYVDSFRSTITPNEFIGKESVQPHEHEGGIIWIDTDYCYDPDDDTVELALWMTGGRFVKARELRRGVVNQGLLIESDEEVSVLINFIFNVPFVAVLDMRQGEKR